MTMNGASLFSLAAGTLAACMAVAGPAGAATESRTVEPFHAVSFEGSWTVDVTAGKPQSVVIEGDQDTIGHVKTEVVDGRLRVSLERSLFARDNLGKLAAHITVPSLDRFSRAGSGNAILAGLDGGKIALASDGSGTIKADGQVASVSLAMNGSGDADLAGLKSDGVNIAINGSGDASVQAASTLAVTINGSGSVVYVGEPRVTTAIHGSGVVKKR